MYNKVMTIYILGRQPRIGLAELERVFGSEKVSHIAPEVAFVDAPEQNRPIGSALKIGNELTRFKANSFRDASQKVIPFLEKNLPTDSKVTLGISAYNFDISGHEVQKLGLLLKQKRKRHDFSTRLIPNKEASLNSAQVLHNKLTSSHKWEILLMKTFENEVILAKTTHVQDITAYTQRDRGRPMRDSRVGMLPPKLAQTIINLAIGNKNPNKEQIHLLDPFCGTGVILQEALLIGCLVIGSDIDQRMIDYSKANINWLHKRTKKYGGTLLSLWQGDATSFGWQGLPDTIACETYLGRPFSTEPDKETLQKVIHDCNAIHRKFLVNVARQTKSGLPLCLAVPAWHIKNKIYHLPVLDDLENLGYNRLDFTHASNEDLIYYREGQIVGRELLVLIRR